MTRTISSAVETATESSSGYTMTIAAELNFESGTVRVHALAGTITFPDGRQFTGVGQFGKVSAVEETTEIKAPTIEIGLSGIQNRDISPNVSSVLGENIRNRKATHYLVFFDPTTGAVIDEPLKLFKGRLDNVILRLGKTFEIACRVESILAFWSRPRAHRYTDEWQQNRYPGDLGLQFVPQMVEKEIKWGRS